MSSSKKNNRKEFLTIEKLLAPVKNLMRQLRMIKYRNESSVNWHDLYGSGEGLWQDDAQDYVNTLRTDR